jgi:hypothetical protein
MVHWAANMVHWAANMVRWAANMVHWAAKAVFERPGSLATLWTGYGDAVEIRISRRAP